MLILLLITRQESSAYPEILVLIPAMCLRCLLPAITIRQCLHRLHYSRPSHRTSYITLITIRLLSSLTDLPPSLLNLKFLLVESL